MPTTDLDPVLQSILREDAEHPAQQVDLQVALSDPTLRGVIDRATRRYEGLLTPKAIERAQRTLAHVFANDPAAAALLAKMREEGASRAVPAAAAKEEAALKKKRTP